MGDIYVKRKVIYFCLLVCCICLSCFDDLNGLYDDMNIEDHMYVLQPGPEGIDTYAGDTYTTTGDPNQVYLTVGGWGDSYYIWLMFNISSLPVNAVKAEIHIYCHSSVSGTLVSMNLDRITSAWPETVGWAGQPSAVNISSIGAPVLYQWYIIDITSLYNGWKSSTYPNYGIRLRPTGTSNQFNRFYSSDYPDDPSLRPKLVVYTQ